MRYKPFFSTPFVASLTIGFVFFALLTLLLELPNRQIIQKNAASAQDVYIYFVPSNTIINTNQVTVSMYAKFTNGNASEKIDYFKTSVVLPPGGQLIIPSNSYVKTTFPSNSFNFDRIINVDGPTISNTNKGITIELASMTAGGGPTTDPTQNGGAGLKVAEFVVQKNQAASWTSGSALGFKIDPSLTQVVVSPLSEVIPLNSSSTTENGLITYDPTYGISPTPTNTPPTPTLTMTPTPTPTQIPISWTITAQAVCVNGVQPSGSSQLFYALWPPNPLTWNTDTLSTNSTHTKVITSTDSTNNVYIGLQDNIQTALVPYGTPPNANITYATYFNPPTYMAEWQRNSLPAGSYTLLFQAPSTWCILPTPTPTRTPTPVPPTATNVPPTLTPSPTPISCPRKAQGDANCDGVIDGIDYSIWLNTQCHPVTGAFCTAQPINHNADFNNDTNTDDTDYMIWFSHRWT